MTDTAKAIREFKPDLMTSAGGKMLAAFFIAMKIEPSLAGLIKATGNDPEAIFRAIGEAADKAPHVMGQVEEILTAFRAMNERDARIEAKLDVLLEAQNIEPNGFDVRRALSAVNAHRALTAPIEEVRRIRDAQLVEQAALDEASGRS